MTYVMQKATGLHPYQVLGSGTMLDTARLRYEIGNFFEVNPASVHGYIMGNMVIAHSYLGQMLISDVNHFLKL